MGDEVEFLRLMCVACVALVLVAILADGFR